MRINKFIISDCWWDGIIIFKLKTLILVIYLSSIFFPALGFLVFIKKNKNKNKNRIGSYLPWLCACLII